MMVIFAVTHIERSDQTEFPYYFRDLLNWYPDRPMLISSFCFIDSMQEHAICKLDVTIIFPCFELTCHIDCI